MDTTGDSGVMLRLPLCHMCPLVFLEPGDDVSVLVGADQLIGRDRVLTIHGPKQGLVRVRLHIKCAIAHITCAV